MGLAAPGLRLGIDRLRLRKVRWLGGGLAKAASSEKGNPEAWSPCRQDVGSTCPDVAGRQTTAAGVGGPVTCNDTPFHRCSGPSTTARWCRMLRRLIAQTSQVQSCPCYQGGVSHSKATMRSTYKAGMWMRRLPGRPACRSPKSRRKPPLPPHSNRTAPKVECDARDGCRPAAPRVPGSGGRGRSDHGDSGPFLHRATRLLSAGSNASP